MTGGLGYVALGCGAYQVCSNDIPRLTLTFLASRSNLLPNAFKLEFYCDHWMSVVRRVSSVVNNCLKRHILLNYCLDFDQTW